MVLMVTLMCATIMFAMMRFTITYVDDDDDDDVDDEADGVDEDYAHADDDVDGDIFDLFRLGYQTGNLAKSLKYYFDAGIRMWHSVRTLSTV